MTSADVVKYIDVLVNPIVYKAGSPVAAAAELRLMSERKRLATAIDQAAVRRFKAWTNMFTRQKNEGRVQQVVKLEEAYLADSPAA